MISRTSTRKLAGLALAATSFFGLSQRSAQATTATTVADTVSRYHVVQPGESLWRIYRSEGVPDTLIPQKLEALCTTEPRFCTDNRAVYQGRVTHQADGIPGDYIVPGDSVLVGTKTVWKPVKHTPKQSNLPLLYAASASLGMLLSLYPKHKPVYTLENALDDYLGRHDTSRTQFDTRVEDICTKAGITQRELYKALDKRQLGRRSEYAAATRDRLAYTIARSSASAKELAQELGVSLSTVYRYRKVTSQQRLEYAVGAVPIAA